MSDYNYHDYNCPDCNEAKLQSDKNARKINQVIEQVNALIDFNNDNIENTEKIVRDVAEEKVNEALSNFDIEELIDGKVEAKINEELSDINTEIDNLESEVNELKEGNIDIDLTNYVTKSELSSKADKTELHSHTNKSVLDGITSAKITEWNNKSTVDGNYNSLTNKPTTFEPSSHSHSINDISDYPNDLVTKDYVDEAINNAKLEGGDTQVDLSIYAK